MKTNIIFKIVFIAVFLFSLKTYSHPPAKINLDFNNEEKILKVEVIHPVLSTGNHYIKKIEIFLNDNLKITQDFKRQITKESQKAIYLIFEAGEGDTIKINATCNKYGNKTESLVVKKTSKEK